MSISARDFVVHLARADETQSRAARRIHLHADLLKAAKLIAGDILALTSADESRQNHFSVGIAWPRTEGPVDCKA